MKPCPTALILTLSLAAGAAFAAEQNAAAPAPPPAAAAAPGARGSTAVVRPNVPIAPYELIASPSIAALQASHAALRRNYAARQRRLEAARRQLGAARRRLEVAAQQVARLSAEMSAEMSREISSQMTGRISRRLAEQMTITMRALTGPPHALIGIQITAVKGMHGVRVQAVSPGGPAEQAGIRAGDLIVAVDGHEVRGHHPARRVVELLRRIRPGDRVTLRILRSGAAREVAVIARAAMPEVFLARRLGGPSARFSPWGGPMILGGPVADMQLARVSRGLGRYFGTSSGVLVVRAAPGGALGLKDGDVILAIGHRKVADSSHVIRILASYDPGEKIRIQVMRNHQRIAFTTSMPAAAGQDVPFAGRPAIAIRTPGATL